MASHDEVISLLGNFELDKNEAMLYIALTQTGSATVNTISAKLGVDKGRIYRSLHRLQNLGLVSASFSNPTTCYAAEPDKALTELIKRKEEQLLTMQKTANKIVKEVMQFKNPHDSLSQIPSLYIIQGRPNIYSRIGKLLEESSRTVYIVTTVHDLMRMYYTNIPEKIAMCKQNGGIVRIITELNSSYESLNQIKDLNADEVKLVSLPSKNRIVLSQDQRLIMSGYINESMSLTDEVDSSLYTNSKGIIESMHCLCTHLWDISKQLEVKTQIR